MSVSKIVIHTDVFLDHLRGDRRPSLLREAMGKFFCYTTVFHAIELFSFAKSEREQRVIEDVMASMKVLGLNPKGARTYGELFAGRIRRNTWSVMIAGLCMESRLPLLTDRTSEFKGIRGLVLVPTRMVRNYDTAADILKAVRR